MRVSTLQIYKRNVSLMNNAQQSVLTEQQNIATGKKIHTPSDDPVASARITSLNQRLALAEKYTLNAKYASTTLAQQESNLGEMTEALTRLKEIQTRSGSDILHQTAREALALEAQEILEQLVSIANMKDANGNYMYAGASSKTQPFMHAGEKILYQGDNGQRNLSVSNSLNIPISTSGLELFMNISNSSGDFTVTAGVDATIGGATGKFPNIAVHSPNTGTKTVQDITVIDRDNYIENIDNYFIKFQVGANTTYTVSDSAGKVIKGPDEFDSSEPITFGGIAVQFDSIGSVGNGDVYRIEPTPRQSMFETVQRMITNLRRTTVTEAEQQRVLSENENIMYQLDLLHTHISQQQTELGSHQQSIERAKAMNEDIVLNSKSAIALLEDTDMAESITKMKGYTLSLQAAQQAFVQVQRLSLFNFL